MAIPSELWQQEARGVNPPDHAVPKDFESKWTIEIGGKSPQGLLSELLSHGHRVGRSAREMLGNQGFITVEFCRPINLKKLSIGDLGFTDLTPYNCILEAAQTQGYGPVPAEVGVYLRQAYCDQLKGESLAIGMEPTIDTNGEPRVFNLESHDDGLWLRTRWAQRDYGWNPRTEIVFEIPQ